ncbi:MAG: hypothetical protein ACRC7O_13790 [Fimbriiglobus sp.]
MRTFLVGLAFALVTPVPAADPDPAQLEKFFDAKNVRVAWKAVPAPDPSSTLEISDGAGHGDFRWLRFRPGKAGVEVLSIESPSLLRATGEKSLPVTVRRAVLKPQVYAALLHYIATVDAADVQKIPRNEGFFSSADIWCHARMADKDKVLVDLEWTGYIASEDVAHYARPQATVTLARLAIGKLKFEKYELTAADRDWASEKVARDCKRFAGEKSTWWVEERSLALVAVVGNGKDLPPRPRSPAPPAAATDAPKPPTPGSEKK